VPPMSIVFIENHPVLSAILIATLGICAVAFELLSLKQTAVSVWTAILGLIGIGACFTGADHLDRSSVLAVAFILLLYCAAIAALWRRT
jgi:hypothetical protein